MWRDRRQGLANGIWAVAIEGPRHKCSSIQSCKRKRGNHDTTRRSHGQLLPRVALWLSVSLLNTLRQRLCWVRQPPTADALIKAEHVLPRTTPLLYDLELPNRKNFCGNTRILLGNCMRRNLCLHGENRQHAKTAHATKNLRSRHKTNPRPTRFVSGKANECR